MKKCMICGNEAPADAPFGFGFSVTGLLRRERDPLLSITGLVVNCAQSAWVVHFLKSFSIV